MPCSEHSLYSIKKLITYLIFTFIYAWCVGVSINQNQTKPNGRSKINALVYYVAGIQGIPGIGEESIMPRVMIGNNTLGEKRYYNFF